MVKMLVVTMMEIVDFIDEVCRRTAACRNSAVRVPFLKEMVCMMNAKYALTEHGVRTVNLSTLAIFEFHQAPRQPKLYSTQTQSLWPRESSTETAAQK